MEEREALMLALGRGLIGDLSEDADNSESDNEPVRERRPQRSTRGQLPVRYRDVYVLK